jgi:hypothetical protein
MRGSRRNRQNGPSCRKSREPWWKKLPLTKDMVLLDARKRAWKAVASSMALEGFMKPIEHDIDPRASRIHDISAIHGCGERGRTLFRFPHHRYPGLPQPTGSWSATGRRCLDHATNSRWPRASVSCRLAGCLLARRAAPVQGFTVPRLIFILAHQAPTLLNTARNPVSRGSRTIKPCSPVLAGSPFLTIVRLLNLPINITASPISGRRLDIARLLIWLRVARGASRSGCR